MTTQQPAPPAGWWQASDGNWYPPQDAEPTPTPTTGTRRRWGRRLFAGLTGIVLFVGGVAAGAGGNTAAKKASDRADRLARFLADEKDVVATRDATIWDLRAQQAAAAGALAKRAADLDKRKADLDAREKAISDRSKALDAREAGLKASQFSDGLFQVGRDIAPGSYHTDGADSCYWAELRSSSTNDISSNNLGAGPQTVTVQGPYFESKDCGTWTKVG
ncbi:MAG: hypothetical protein ACYDAD_07975 [Acidimicrobiales bacterium]